MMNLYEGITLFADIFRIIIQTIYYILESIYHLIIPVRQKSVTGEIVVITGAGHGIGREMALKYASLGAIVICLDLNDDNNQETIDEIKKMDGTIAYAYRCDVSNPNEVFGVAKKVQAEVGHPTILVNNAGIMPTSAFLDYKTETIKKLVEINFLGCMWTMQAYLPSMVANNYGHVVAIASMTGVVGIRNLVPYCATKWGVRGLMESMTDEFGGRESCSHSKLKFTTVNPYMVDSGLCVNPRVRFPSILSLLTPKEVAKHAVIAQRREEIEVTIPAVWGYLNAFSRLLPLKAVYLLRDFLNSGVDL